jgi:hypothetical protein
VKRVEARIRRQSQHIIKVIRKAAYPVLTVPPRAHATSALPFKRLLCAADFSDPSLAALAFGCSLARELGGALTILRGADSKRLLPGS